MFLFNCLMVKNFVKLFYFYLLYGYFDLITKVTNFKY